MAAKDPTRSRRDVAWVCSTYFAEGLPYSLVHQVAAEYFTAAGASLRLIGLTSNLHIPWTLKFLWSPLVDLVGTTRRWLVVTEALLAAVFVAVAWPAQALDFDFVVKLLVLASVLAATHDVAIDGFYLRGLGDRQQAAYSGLRVSAYRVALIAGKGGLVFLAGVTSWKTCFVVSGAMLAALALLHQLLLPRPEALAPPSPAAPESERRFVDALASWVRQPAIGWSIAFIVMYRAGDAMMFAMSSPLLKSLGLSTQQRGLVAGTVGTAASIVGSMIGGWWFSKSGFARAIFPVTFVQSLAIPAYAWMAFARPGLFGVACVVVIEQLAAGIGTAGLAVFLMRRSSGPYKATHFAVGSALMNLTATAAGDSSGYLAEALGFPLFFALAFVASWPSVALAFKIKSVG